eukprot:3486902-Alexandrium_andersonii.AAC.1
MEVATVGTPLPRSPQIRPPRWDWVPTFRQLRGDPKVPTQARIGPNNRRQNTAAEHFPTQHGQGGTDG